MLVDTQAWEELFAACEILLTNAQPKRKDEEGYDARGADWLVWECFIRAVRELGTKRFVISKISLSYLTTHSVRQIVSQLKEKITWVDKVGEVLTKGTSTSELWNTASRILSELLRFTRTARIVPLGLARGL